MSTPLDQSPPAPPVAADKPEPLPRSVEAWLNTPLNEHVARWQREIAEGLRDANGRWIADPSLRRSRLRSTTKN
jgi:hypothetical protein